uniref:Uncharacterized protein n=1 Tax=Rhizophora mucronata TaxID=61149 RepID=A0A2P2QS27_RHIMU
MLRHTVTLFNAPWEKLRKFCVKSA